MSTLLAPEPTTTDTGDPDIVHCFHSCDPNVALCGVNVEGEVELTEVPEDDMCVVCSDLALGSEGICPRCGKAGW